MVTTPRQQDDLRNEIEVLKKQLDAVSDSERRYRMLVESARDFIFIVDREGIIQYVNPFGAEAIRMPAGEAVGLPLSRLFPANAERQAESINRVLSTGSPWYAETVTEFPAGKICLDTWLIPLASRSGKLDRVLGVSRDVTERRLALDQLKYRICFEETIARISRRFINIPIEQLDEAITDALAELGGFVGADRASIRMRAVQLDSADEVYNWVRDPSVAIGEGRDHWPWDAHVLRQQKVILVRSPDDIPDDIPGEGSRDLEFLRSDGMRALLLVPLVYGGGTVGFVVFASTRGDTEWSAQTQSLFGVAGEVFTNALMRKRVEEERVRMASELVRAEQLDSIGILAGGIAHDFNNILAAIMGNVSLARSELARHGGVSFRLKEAEKGLARARELTQQLLTFAKGGSPVKRVIDLGALARESAVFATRGSKVRPSIETRDDLWPVEADSGQISQVMHNIVINAEHAMSQGGVVQISTENVCLPEDSGIPLPAGNYVRVTVRDSGPGIAPEHLPLIFVPYFTTKPTGTGLGLATSYNIVRKHGGLITVDSREGEGTSFSVFLPAAPNADPTSKSGEHQVRIGQGRVLVVDDDDAVRSSAVAMLEHLGYQTQSVASGEDAVEAYRRAASHDTPFAIVLMDLTLPGGMSGKDAFERIRAFDPDALAIVSSGYSEDLVMAGHDKHGFRGVLKKPYGLLELGDALHAVLSDATRTR